MILFIKNLEFSVPHVSKTLTEALKHSQDIFYLFYFIYTTLKLFQIFQASPLITFIELSDDLKTQLVDGTVICAISSYSRARALVIPSHSVLEDLKIDFLYIFLLLKDFSFLFFERECIKINLNCLVEQQSKKS